MFFALVLFASSSDAQQLSHPGGWHTQADLTVIRSNVKAGKEPWITGWNAVKDKGPNKNYKITASRVVTNKSELAKQGHAAYQLAIKWVASGDQGYADAAIGIIDEMVKTVDRFDVEGPTLTLSTGGGYLAQAAEILCHGFKGEAGWSPAKVKAAQAWFKNKVYDKWTNTGRARSANWGTSCVGGNMSMAVFCDNKTMLRQQVDAYKFGYRDTADGCAGVAQYIFSPTGQAFESGRDQAHVQGGIGHLVEGALTHGTKESIWSAMQIIDWLLGWSITLNITLVMMTCLGRQGYSTLVITGSSGELTGSAQKNAASFRQCTLCATNFSLRLGKIIRIHLR